MESLNISLELPWRASVIKISSFLSAIDGAVFVMHKIEINIKIETNSNCENIQRHYNRNHLNSKMIISKLVKIKLCDIPLAQQPPGSSPCLLAADEGHVRADGGRPRVLLRPPGPGHRGRVHHGGGAQCLPAGGDQRDQGGPGAVPVSGNPRL